MSEFELFDSEENVEITHTTVASFDVEDAAPIQVEIAETGVQGPQGQQGVQGVQGEKGDKGEPGGWTEPEVWWGDLNQKTAPGLYYIPWADNLVEKNAPSGDACHVQVYSINGWYIVQRAQRVNASSEAYIRHSTDYGATWSAWSLEGAKALENHTAATHPHPQYFLSTLTTTNSMDLDNLTTGGSYFCDWSENMITTRHTPVYREGYLQVHRTPYGDGVYQIYSAVTPTQREPLVFSRTRVNGTWSKWVPQGALSGQGFPEGWQYAPVGTRYIDTNATAGAVEWIKTSGEDGSPYGWRPSYADTGWIDMSPFYTPNPGDTLHDLSMRRVNERVTVQGFINTGAASATRTSLDLFLIPQGFRPRRAYAILPAGNVYNQIWIIGTPSDGAHLVLNANEGTFGEGTNVVFEVSWIVQNSSEWPASLPTP